MAPDPFGRAILDSVRGERTEPLVQRDGAETLDHPIERFYLADFDAASDDGAWLASRLSGPLLDLGAGAGRHALHFQSEFDVVAVEKRPALVTAMRERGVEDPREGDMFALREQFDRDAFASALVVGTQLGLAKSVTGLRALLGDLAFVTDPEATAVVDCYDPTRPGTADLLGFRDDPAPGLASRVMTFAYEGDVASPLLFRLFSPDRLREAAAGTGWRVAEVRHTDGGHHYRAALAKR
jgi:hypothetical protein